MKHGLTSWFAHGLLVMSAAACEMTGAPARVQAPVDSAAGEVGFEMAGPNEAVILVPVQINGRAPIDFVLDTGATLTCVDQTLARELRLPEREGVGGFGVGVTQGARLQLVEIDSLRVGNAAAYDMVACTLDLAHIRDAGLETGGLLGLNFLKSFDVALDFDRRVLRLQEPAD